MKTILFLVAAVFLPASRMAEKPPPPPQYPPPGYERLELIAQQLATKGETKLLGETLVGVILVDSVSEPKDGFVTVSGPDARQYKYPDGYRRTDPTGKKWIRVEMSFTVASEKTKGWKTGSQLVPWGPIKSIRVVPETDNDIERIVVTISNPKFAD